MKKRCTCEIFPCHCHSSKLLRMHRCSKLSPLNGIMCAIALPLRTKYLSRQTSAQCRTLVVDARKKKILNSEISLRSERRMSGEHFFCSFSIFILQVAAHKLNGKNAVKWWDCRHSEHKVNFHIWHMWLGVGRTVGP